MTAAVDFHMHMYPGYSAAVLFKSFIDNIEKDFPENNELVKVACMAERRDQNIFRKLASGDKTFLPAGWNVKTTLDGLAVKLTKDDRSFYIVCGRQIIAKERLEVLSLTLDITIDDGLPVFDVIEKVLASGGIPVLAWAPGKWVGSRGEIVREILAKYKDSKDICLGDSSLRPGFYKGGEFMCQGIDLGFNILPGSDPLPFKGEEKRSGSNSVLVDIQGVNPGSELRDFIKAGNRVIKSKKKFSFYSVIYRLVLHELSKKIPGLSGA